MKFSSILIASFFLFILLGFSVSSSPMEIADFIVAGAGTAGCALARRLVDAGFSVLLLEAGSEVDPSDISFILPGVGGNAVSARWDYQYFTSDPRRVRIYSGRVVGGGGMINGMKAFRGDPNYYNRLANEFGLTNWDYSSLLPLFKKMENNLISGQDPAYHGVGGNVDVALPSFNAPGNNEFATAAAAATFANNDFNGPLGTNGFGIGPVYNSPSATYGNTRNNSYYGYLKPIRQSNLLNLETQAEVLRVLFNGNKRAYGVEFLQNGVFRRGLARFEVILTAGAIRSPTILLHSGVGPASELTALDIPVVYDSPRVGKGLQDHLYLPYRRKNACFTAPADLPKLALSSPSTAMGFINSTYSPGYADLQLQFSPFGLRFVTQQFFFDEFSIYIIQVAPNNTGSVSVFSNNPLDAPKITMNYVPPLGSTDLLSLEEGVLFVENQILTHPAFAPCVASDRIVPFPGTTIQDFIRSDVASTQHPAASCSMGTSSTSCLDADLKVRGVSRLRIADNSAWPLVPNANTAVPAIVIAERAAELLIAQYS